MTRILIPFLLITVIACGNRSEIATDSIAPEIAWRPIDQVWTADRSPERRVLVNIHTEWCEFCRKMDSDVYPDSTVRRVVNDHFVTAGINADSDRIVRFKGEEMTERALARRLGVRSYPTMVFMEPDGTIILQMNGFMPAADFIRMLTYIGSSAYQRMDFADYHPEETRASR